VHNADAAETSAIETGHRRLLTFNRQWLDHCLSTDSLDEDFVFTEAELSSGAAFQLSITLNQLAKVRHELNGTVPFGLHCRGLLGHLALPVSVLKKFGTPLRHSHRISIYGTDDDTTENTQAVVSTGTAKKYKITVDGITESITVEMEVSEN
jgi:hypothetical protein